MNIFRLSGDLSHLASYLILLYVLFKKRNASGKWVTGIVEGKSAPRETQSERSRESAAAYGEKKYATVCF